MVVISLNIIVLIYCLATAESAAILPLRWIPPAEQRLKLPFNANEAGNIFGYIEAKPNGTLFLRSAMENETNAQNLLLFNAIVSALKLMPNEGGIFNNPMQNKLNIKIYGDGVEHKFPPFMEQIIQRIQTYFSIYKYVDTSRPNAQQVEVAAMEQAQAQAQAQADAQAHAQATQLDLPGTWLQSTTTILPDSAGTTMEIDNYVTTTMLSTNDYANYPDIDENIDLTPIAENDSYIKVGED